MDAGRWQRLESIFHAVADLPEGAGRDAELTVLCGSDQTLLTEARALLAEDERLKAKAASFDPHIGLRLDNYQIDALIARGGMAAVYSAHRADDQFHQRVAIKIMDVRLSDPVLVSQFRAERQILATLEHPTLTRLLDGGVTVFGEPYLVMEYVDGVPIDRYCDTARLDVAARVRLFRRICEGIAFAHSKLVLHRDLKPSNVLVTGDGHPKVVDFGTATLLQPGRLETLSRAPLTPAYASPEQLTGLAVGTASDQYSLGLVLYELLTGTILFGDRTSLMMSIERALAGTAPPIADTTLCRVAAESRRSTVPALRRHLTGDLGRIIQKVLANDAALRYASVSQFADDLDRWLQGEPILARPPSVAYRTSRFVRKHWISVSVAATLALALLAAAGVAIRQTGVSREQAAIARSESARAQAVNVFLTEMLSSANPTWINTSRAEDGPLTVRRMLDGAGELLNGRSGMSADAEAEMRRTLGQTFLGLGAFAQAQPHLERALELYRQRGDALGIATTEAALGLERVQAGDMIGAERFLRDALAFVRARGANTDPAFRFSVLNDLGGAVAHIRPGDPEAVALLTEAVDVARTSVIDDVGAGVALLHLGTALLRRGQLDAAEAALTEALSRIDRTSRDRPERNSALRTFSLLRLLRGDAAAAERFGAEAVEGGARTRPAEHPLQASYKHAWGLSLLALGRLDEAEQQLTAALATYRAIRPPGHFELMGPLTGLGALWRVRGQHVESERVLREARAIAERHPEHEDRAAEIAGELGLTLRARGRRDEGDALVRESYAIARRAFGEAHPMTVRAASRLPATLP
jgi:eukaryotic-like serine/threonine-protein kinase